MGAELVLNRRNAVMVAGLAAFAGIGAAPAQSALASIRSGGGVAGGGWLNFGPSEAQFSVFGSRFETAEGDETLFFGTFAWADAAGFSLASTEIVNYGPDPDDEQARIMSGYLSRSDNDNIHAFRVRLADRGRPGEGKDRIELLVGGVVEQEAEFPDLSELDAMISVDHEITVGDIQLLTFEFPAAS